MYFQRLLLAFFLLIFFTGCSTVTRKALAPEATKNISSVSAILAIPADEIIIRAEPSNVSAAMGYGLIPALIDGAVSSSRQSKLEKISAEFYAKVDLIDFRSIFGNAFKESVKKQQILNNLNSSVTTKGLSKATVASYIKELKPNDAFLGLRIWYEFSADFKNIMMFADVQLYTKNQSGNAEQEPIYKNGYVYISAPVVNNNPLDAWALENGKVLSKIYADGADEIAKMMQQDFADPANDLLFASLANNEKIKYTVPTYMPWTINGYITSKSESRQSVRVDTGIMLSIPK